jgi:hypothetical protein
MVKGTRGRWWWALGARTRAEASCCVLVSHAMHGPLYIQGECRPGRHRCNRGCPRGLHAASRLSNRRMHRQHTALVQPCPWCSPGALWRLVEGPQLSMYFLRLHRRRLT